MLHTWFGVKTLRQFRRAYLLAIAAVLVICFFMASGWGEDVVDRVEMLIGMFHAGRVETLPELLGDLQEHQSQFIELAPPGMNYLIYDRGLTWFDPAKIPARVRKKIVPGTYEGVTVYPVIAYEDRVTRARVFLNARGRKIASIRPSAGYDPRWLALEKHPDLYDGSRSDEEIEQMLKDYDPSRVVVLYRLVTRDNLFEYIARNSPAEASAETIAREALAGATEGRSIDEPQCTAIQHGPDGVQLTISYPEGFSNRLDLFSCTNLMGYLWRLRLDAMDTPPDTNRLDWVDSDGSPSRRFYAVAAANCDEITDPDDDGLTSTREKLLHNTDPQLSDTDSDGMPDGWEATHMLNPLLDDSTDDPDNDGWNNLQEYRRGGRPGVSLIADTNNTLGLTLMTPTRGAEQ